MLKTFLCPAALRLARRTPAAGSWVGARRSPARNAARRFRNTGIAPPLAKFGSSGEHGPEVEQSERLSDRQKRRFGPVRLPPPLPVRARPFSVERTGTVRPLLRVCPALTPPECVVVPKLGCAVYNTVGSIMVKNRPDGQEQTSRLHVISTLGSRAIQKEVRPRNGRRILGGYYEKSEIFEKKEEHSSVVFWSCGHHVCGKRHNTLRSVKSAIAGRCLSIFYIRFCEQSCRPLPAGGRLICQ